MYDINDFMSYAGNGNTPTRKIIRKIQPATRNKVNAAPVFVAAPPMPAKLMALPSGPVKVYAYQGEQADPQPTQPLPSAPTKPALELVNYSDRSFAIFGDTKPIQAKLEGLGGRFNRWLKKDGIPTPGYIFSIGRIESVQKSLNL